jgi:CubicO group peptidase (beta-lactamase class C family)
MRSGPASEVEARLRRTVEAASGSRDIGGVVVRVEQADGSFAWTGSAGDLAPDSPFFIASTTKLVTTAIVLQLAEQGRLALDDRLVDRVDAGLVRGLHMYRGTDQTDRITVRHLLAHTSGLPDYFMGKDHTGVSLEHRLRAGTDTAWTLDDVLAMTRRMTPAFEPGRHGKALYSDTNFQLLGRIIEDATGRSYAEAVRTAVIEPLGLAGTWLYADADDARPVPMRDGPRRLHIPQAMTSFGPDGGIVASVGDLMRFVRGFFEGRLFDPAVLPGLKVYNRIFFPLEYGVGFARFRWPRILSPLAAQPELIGHSGLSGAFAFLAPDRGTYLAGTVNNLARPDRSFRLMLRLLADVRRLQA